MEEASSGGEPAARPLLVTLDTGVLDDAGLATVQAALSRIHYKLAVVSVGARERGLEVDIETIPETAVWGESFWGGALWGGGPIEPMALDESRLDLGVIESQGDRFEAILQIISNGSMPPPGGDRRKGKRRNQLRDAMAFDAHVREGRDLFVTTDVKGFIRHGRREKLERLGNTLIREPGEISAEEFAAWGTGAD